MAEFEAADGRHRDILTGSDLGYRIRGCLTEFGPVTAEGSVARLAVDVRSGDSRATCRGSLASARWGSKHRRARPACGRPWHRPRRRTASGSSGVPFWTATGPTVRTRGRGLGRSSQAEQIDHLGRHWDAQARGKPHLAPCSAA